MPLIDASELAELLRADPTTVVVDVRWSLSAGALGEEYARGHIDGAVFLDLDRDLCGVAGPDGRHPLPEPGQLTAVLRRSGIDDDSAVVVYDGGDMMAAARTWWTLRWAGLGDVRVLDGGVVAWNDAQLPVTSVIPEPTPGAVTVRPGHLPVLDADGAAERARVGALLDVRAPERFRGEDEPIDPVAGHIPGAKNLFGGANVASKGGFVSREELAVQFADCGDDTAVYCGSGVTAARTALAMAAAGRAVPPVYIGSWSNWCALDRPADAGGA